VWAAHRTEANSTMEDSDDVLLLKPARSELSPRLGAQPAPPSPSGEPSTVLIGIYQLPEPAEASLVSRFEQHTAPILRANRVEVWGVYVTESAPNTFTRLPVRDRDHVLVWIGVAPSGWKAPESTDRLAEAAALDDHPLSLLELEPTPRSILGGGLEASRATRPDFVCVCGSGTIHNRYFSGRRRQSTEWIEFDAQSRVEPLLDGFGHLDRYSAVRDGSPFEGITLRLFDPGTGEWSIYWADTVRART